MNPCPRAHRVSLDDLDNAIGEALAVLSAEPVVVTAELSDWHLSKSIGRGRIHDPATQARLDVVVPAWKQHRQLARGDLVEICATVQWDRRWGLQLVADRQIRRVDVSDAHQRQQDWFAELHAKGSPQHLLRIPRPTSHVALIGPAGGDAALSDTRSVLETLDDTVVVTTTRIPMGGDKAVLAFSTALAAVRPDADLVLVVRGGGAASDLDAWNDPATVERIANCPIPIVCGLGHATDITAAGLVAHHGAVTPTAAAHWVLHALAAQPVTPAPIRPVRPVTAPRPTPIGPQPAPPRDLSLIGIAAAALVVVVVLVLLAL